MDGSMIDGPNTTILRKYQGLLIACTLMGQSDGRGVPMGDEGNSSAEQLRVLFRQLPIALAVNLANAAIMATVLAPVAGTWPVIMWFASMLMVTCFRYAVCQWYLHPERLKGSVPRWDIYSILGAGLTGLIWGIGGVILLPPQTMQQVFVVFTIGGMCAGAVVVHSSHFPSLLSFLLPATVPVAARFILEGTASDIGLGGMMLVFAAALSVAGYNLNRSLVETLRLKFDLVRRARDLESLNARLLHESGERRESEERFRTVANSAPVLIWVSGQDKLRDFFNQSWLEFTGRLLEAEIGTGWVQGVHPQDVRQCLDAYHAAFDARRPFEVEYRLRRRDGEYRWIYDKGVPRYAPNGDFVGYIGSAIDIADRKRVEELSNALAHLQRLAIIGELSAAIAHEVRQPLNAMQIDMATAKDLLDTANPPLNEIGDIISDIGKSLSRVDEVFSRTLAFSRKKAVQSQPVDINTAVAEVLSLVAFQAAQRCVQMSSDLAPELPLALGDRTQLQQVLLNLIINGMEAMANKPEPARQLKLQTKRDGNSGIEVLVIDRGDGIPEATLPRLFDAFFTTKKEGTGLGLSVAGSIIAAHQGRIWVENNSNGGATFHFTVRAA